MAFSEPWCVGMTRGEMIDVVVTDELERVVWEDGVESLSIWEEAEGGPIESKITREEYESRDREWQAKFLAKFAVALGLSDFCESTGERVAVYEAYPQHEDA